MKSVGKPLAFAAATHSLCQEDGGSAPCVPKVMQNAMANWGVACDDASCGYECVLVRQLENLSVVSTK